MNKFNDLYDFIDLAKSNRKYPENTANGLKSALKIFGKQLNLDEINSVDLVEDNIEEIFISVVGANKDKTVASLGTYKTRLLKVIKDYQKYGIDPNKMQNWNVSSTKALKHIIKKKDIQDKEEDKDKITLSDHVNTPVHKIELSFKNNRKFLMLLPKDIDQKEAESIKKIIDSLSN